MADWKSSLRGDPSGLLLDSADPPIRYRVLKDILDKPADDQELKNAKAELAKYSPILKVARMQKKDGSFGKKMISSSARDWEKTMECCITTLREYGCDKEWKVVRNASKVLKKLLKIRGDINYWEFKGQIKADVLRQNYYRWLLKIFALGMLSQLGYNCEVRVRDGVLEVLEQVSNFVSDPIAKNPIERTGTYYPIIKPEAFREGYPFIPDYYTFLLFSNNDWLLNGEFAKIHLKKIFDYMLSGTYQDLGPAIGMVKTAKGYFSKGWGIEIRSIDYYLKHGSLDYFITLMDMFSKLGLINRYPILMNNMDWLLRQQQKDGTWNLDISYFSTKSKWSQYLRLEKDWKSPRRKIADLTFRLILIMKNQWVNQIKMLERYEESFPI